MLSFFGELNPEMSDNEFSVDFFFFDVFSLLMFLFT